MNIVKFRNFKKEVYRIFDMEDEETLKLFVGGLLKREISIMKDRGLQLNPNENTVKGIMRMLHNSKGMCPCIHGEVDYDTFCPCDKLIENNECICTLWTPLQK